MQLMEQKQWDEPLLKELSQAMMDASICGLGQAAPNPMLSVLKFKKSLFAGVLEGRPEKTAEAKP